MIISPQLENELRKLGSTLRKEGIILEGMYLFGSTARGDNHAWSDIDVGIVSDSFGADRISEMVTLRSLAYPINPAISPIPLRPQDLKDKFSTIGRAIRDEGIRIDN